MLVGLAIAVANIDEVIKLIRASKDANEAREALMERDWPAKDVAAMIALIDDPRHKVSAKAPPSCPPSRPGRSSTCVCSG